MGGNCIVGAIVLLDLGKYRLCRRVCSCAGCVADRSDEGRDVGYHQGDMERLVGNQM